MKFVIIAKTVILDICNEMCQRLGNLLALVNQNFQMSNA